MTSSSEVTIPTTDPTIPAPPDFPVEWADPDDERLFWVREVIHYPDQMTRLQETTWAETWLQGWYAAARAYDLPVVGPRELLVNTYLYTSMAPVIASPEELEARGRRAHQKLGEATAGLGDLWDRAWLPEANAHLAFMESFDLRGASIPELRSYLEEVLDRFKRLAEIHFLVNFPMSIVLSEFDELYRDLFEGAGPFDSYRLLQGFDNRTMQSGRALWAVSRKALESPEVHRILEVTPAANVRSSLESFGAGGVFLAALDAFLAEFGRRSDRWGLECPSWREDPSSVIKNVKDYLDQPDRDLASHLAPLVEERERLVTQARDRLTGYPRPVVDRFEQALEMAQKAIVLSEDHSFVLEFPVIYHIRQAYLEFGRRFVEVGSMERPEDVFHLTLAELRDTADGNPPLDRRRIARERREEWDRFRDVTPPPALGTRPSGPPPNNTLSHAMSKVFGVPARQHGDPRLLVGNAGSPGKARGVARVVHRLADAGRLHPGEILVTETTASPWTPLFATVGAVVTDSGGVLSHSAVVAREYRIPAVVGVGVATTSIKDGQVLEVDGDAGTVRIVSIS